MLEPTVQTRDLTLPALCVPRPTAVCRQPLPACGSARYACQDPERPSLGFPLPGPV
jgi:hypothetical protein